MTALITVEPTERRRQRRLAAALVAVVVSAALVFSATAGNAASTLPTADPITAAVFKEMGGGYTTESGFGRWPKEKDEWKQREFVRRYMSHVEPRPGQLSHEEAASFLRANGLQGSRLVDWPT